MLDFLFFAVFCLVVYVVYLQKQVNRVSDDTKWTEFQLDCHEKWHDEPEAEVVVKSGKLSKSTDDAACYDVYASEEVVIKPGEFALVPTGITTEMDRCDALLFDRSGLALKFWLTRRAGVIDEQYPEEWGVVVANEGRMEYKVNAGDRICQALFVPKAHVKVTACPKGTGEVLVSGQKRVGGFGSTGK